MNLAYRFPIIFWNCANLIVDSGGGNELTENKNTDYAKIARAVNKFQTSGFNISLTNINSSEFDFTPDVENNTILYGLSALSGINREIINKIIEHRPYTSLYDFMKRCPLNKTAMISLIKAGSFDELEAEEAKQLKTEPRYLVMVKYLLRVADLKKKLNLQNVNGLITHSLIPEELEFQQRVYIFHKYLRANQRKGNYYLFNDVCMQFYEKYFDTNKLCVIEGYNCILQTDWDNIYKAEMDKIKQWINQNQKELLDEYNYLLFLELWNKYAIGSISAWEMASVGFYYHEHELQHVNTAKYGLSDFFDLPSIPPIDTIFRKGDKEIPIYKTYKIIGTVISKDDNHYTVHVLTTKGVVPVKFTKEYYSMYNKQISEPQSDGTKKVVDKSWFLKGTKVMLTGFKRDDMFITKSYKRTPTHQLYKITEVKDNGEMELIHERQE